MKYNASHAGGYVRVIKDGEAQGEIYRIGEIWQIRNDREVGNLHLFVMRKGLYTMLCVDPNTSYGVECEWVGMTKPNEQINYSIF